MGRKASNSNGFCDCAECLIGSERIPPPRYHDCDYCRERNQLIPQAEEIANRRVAEGHKNAAEWTRAFAIVMDTLAARLLNGGTHYKTR